jgi:predicted DNA binding CopG/RHH family protein
MIRRDDIPKFSSEAEEAQWWDEHREETAEWMEQAVSEGQTSTLSEVLDRARTRAAGTRPVSIRLAPEDILRARALAAKKGLPYQAYLKMLIHEALVREERAG